MRRRAAALSLVLLLAGCGRAAPRDLVGLWVQPSSSQPLTSDVVVEVGFEAGGGGAAGCWVGRATQDGAPLPVRWPSGTLVGMGSILEVPGGFVVDVGDTVVGDGAVQDVAPDDDPPPAGCDVSQGFVELDAVREVVRPDGG